MGIGFRFKSAHCQMEAAFTMLQQTAQEGDVYFNRNGGSAVVNLCRAGDIFFEYKDGCITGDCQTNVAGPGFHQAAISFMDQYIRPSGLEFEVIDETNYYDHRDFNKMREEHFYHWLSGIIQHLDAMSRAGDYKNLALSWDMDQYMPVSVPGSFIAPMGRFSLEKVQEEIADKGIHALAERYFLWNAPDRDAAFVRNTALEMLWEDCCFMPSARSDEDLRINRRIIVLLEEAFQKDPSLSMPIKEYLELCELDGQKAMSTDRMVPYVSDYPIGFRRGLVENRLGNVTFTLPGNMLFEQEERDLLYYDDLDSGWHSFRFTAFGAKDMFTDFHENIFADCVGPAYTFAAGDGRGKVGYAGIIEDDRVYHQIIAEILSGKQCTLITASFESIEERQWVFDLIEKMTAKVDEQE